MVLLSPCHGHHSPNPSGHNGSTQSLSWSTWSYSVLFLVTIYLLRYYCGQYGPIQSWLWSIWSDSAVALVVIPVKLGPRFGDYGPTQIMSKDSIIICELESNCRFIILILYWLIVEVSNTECISFSTIYCPSYFLSTFSLVVLWSVGYFTLRENL